MPPVLILTTEKEWQDSKTEKRKPICIGFSLEDVIHVESRISQTQD